MNCPRCGYERVTTHQPCPRCGFVPSLSTSQGEPIIPVTELEQQVTSPLTVQPRPSVSFAPVLRASPNRGTSLVPELSLQRNHYLLVEQQTMRQWSPNVYEAYWLAQDLQSGGEVMICEVVLPLNISTLQTFLRSATKALLASSNHAHITKLLDVFMECSRNFFVFEHPVGESIQARIQTGVVVSESEAITCYLQIADALLFLSQQHPPVVHGAIAPDHILNVGSRWMLTPGSVLTAGGAAQLLSQMHIDADIENDVLTPISDLHSLARVMYYAVTGVVPPSDSRVQQAQVANARLSPTFAAVLLKGIHPSIQQRFQHASEVGNALGSSLEYVRGRSLQERRSKALGGIKTNQNQMTSPSSLQPDLNSALPQQSIPLDQQRQREEGWRLLPHPEDLPPIPHAFDALAAIAWTVGILLCATVALLIAR